MSMDRLDDGTLEIKLDEPQTMEQLAQYALNGWAAHARKKLESDDIHRLWQVFKRLRDAAPAEPATPVKVPSPEAGTLDDFWREVERGWSIESREWFQTNYKTRGYSDPVTMAVHHMWKRDRKDRRPGPHAGEGAVDDRDRHLPRRL